MQRVTAVCCALVVLCAAGVSAVPLYPNTYHIVVWLPPAHADALESTFWATATPGTDQYMQWLTVEQLATRFGAASAHTAAAEQWLRQLGASSVHVSSIRHTVTGVFDADAAAVSGVPKLPASLGLPSGAFVMRRDDAAVVAPSADAAPVQRKPRLQGGSYSIPNQKQAYGVPESLTATNPKTQVMVWGPGTFGYDRASLEQLKSSEVPLLNLDKIVYYTKNHGVPGGDNYGEGSLDTTMTSSFALNATIIVANTNTSASTEEGNGFGQALLDFVQELGAAEHVPQTLSMSLGSLSAASCDFLCEGAVKKGVTTLAKCQAYMQTQRQVCMYLSTAQEAAINHGFKVLGLRGVSIFGSSGDGGSHFSFGPFSGFGDLPSTLNDLSCSHTIPVFPTASPYIISVGGSSWGFFANPAKPVAWSGSGGGFSLQYAAPAHQKTTVAKYLQTAGSGLPAASSYNASNRAYPDISAVAEDGTSESCPTIAGLFTLLNDHRINSGLAPLGPIGPRLYQIMEQYPGEAFQDITSGNSKTSCEEGFPATVGWDAVTGWGRPVWAGMLKHFGSDSTTAANTRLQME